MRTSANLEGEAPATPAHLVGRVLAFAIVATLSLVSHVCAESVLKVQASPAAAGVLSAAIPLFKKQGVEVKAQLESSSSALVAALGGDQVDIVVMTRLLTPEERATYPDKPFREHQFATQAIALIAAPDVWESGVRALTRAQMTEIYEGRTKSWKKVGGVDRPVKFFNYEHGRGVWEVFARWLYGDVRKAPLGKFESVSDGEGARNSVHFTSGSLSLAPLRWADGKEVFPLAVVDDSGIAVAPTVENIAAEKYPMARPVLIIVGDRPVRAQKQFVEFFLSEEGQALVRKSDLLSLAEVKPQ